MAGPGITMYSQQSLQMTPPESLTTPPPTPPATDERTETNISRVITAIRSKEKHRSSTDKHWLRFELDAEQYKDLQRRLQQDSSLWNCFKRIRHDYFPSAKLLVLRMPGLLHEILIRYVAKEIERQLTTIAENGSPAAQFARAIENYGSADIVFEDYGTHSPDASYQDSSAQYPAVVIEISHSQKKRDLPRLADEYILGSDGSTHVVIGIDMEYKRSKKATISMWRPQIISNSDGEGELHAVQTVADQLFRDDAGNVVRNSEASLNLCLEDFGTKQFAATFRDLSHTIQISSETLCAYLERAESKAIMRRQKQGVVDPKPWVRKRERERTPPEQLSPNREDKFTEEEQRAAERPTKDDSSYKSSSLEAQ